MTTPHVTVKGTSYAIDQLSDRARLLSSDLVRTIQEYRSLYASYSQSLTLTDTYSGGLKEEVQKAQLPVAIGSDNDPEKAFIKIDGVSYDATEMPDTVKAYVANLVRATKQRTGLEFRLRQIDAARVAYVNELQDEILKSKPVPMDPQP